MIHQNVLFVLASFHCLLFYSLGATLDKEGASVTCDFINENEQGPTYELKILLGHTAKKNEFNVVEVRLFKDS